MVPSHAGTVNCRGMEKPAGEPVYSVSQLNREARMLLEEGLPPLWVTGELSNLARPASGHLYFSLKDEQAQVRCAMFRGAASRGLRFRPENGQQVLMRARAGLYEPRGEYQLIVEHMEPAGDGVLLRRLEELKKRLAAEGLFDPARRRPLPALPRRVGVVTSRTGAAVRDVLQVMRRRFPAIPVILYPVQVQGEQAKHDIVAALATAGRRAECDVLILARGGGSLEDLWAFNEEIVARAIRACPIPVVSGVGHETDFTLADLAADLRAPTPSGAAELVVPDWREWRDRLRQLERAATLAAATALARRRDRLAVLRRRLQRTHPGYVLRQHGQRLDELSARLAGGARRALGLRRLRASHALARLRVATPGVLLERRAALLARHRLRLAAAARARLAAGGSRLAVAAASLQAYSPLNTLQRGYAIVTDAATGAVVRRAADLVPGQAVSARLAEGSVEAVVRRTRPGTAEDGNGA
jgi:exodeoxyribonuclease VII large subunit